MSPHILDLIHFSFPICILHCQLAFEHPMGRDQRHYRTQLWTIYLGISIAALQSPKGSNVRDSSATSDFVSGCSANPPLDTCYGMLQIKDTNGSVLLSNLSVSPRAVNQPSITRGSRSLFNRPWPVTIAILPITSCLSRSLRPCPVLFAIAGVNCGSTSNLHNKSTSTRAPSQLCKKSKLWTSKQFRSEPSFSKELCNAPAKA